MSSVTLPGTTLKDLALPLRLALRELRAGLRGFYVFIACIALGVLAIAAVGSLSASLENGLAREGRTILGGDLSFLLSHREVNAPERAFLEQQGRVSTAATMRAMARTGDERTALVEIKAVDTAYPLFGKVALEPALTLPAALARTGGVFGAAADPALLARLDLAPGARVTIGDVTFELRATLQSEPDKLAGGLGLGPRLLVSQEALRATGLLQPGSLVRWHYRVRLPDNDASEAAVRRTTAAAEERLPEAGWEIRSRSNASPGLERNVERFTQYLTLVGLTALLVGGVGVANAIKGHLDRKRDVIATLKSLGATGRGVFWIYLTQTLLLASIGALPGLVIGAVLPFLISWAFGAIIPLPLAPALYPGNLALAFIYGVMTALAFALWPLGRAHDVSVSALFRDEVEPERQRPRLSYILGTVLVAAALAALAIMLAYDRRIAAIFVAAAAGVFIALRLVASLVMLIARRSPRSRSTVLRLAIANIHRPGALTVSVVLSLGLGLALLVTVIQIDGNLRRQFLAALPEKAPAFFFLDIQGTDAERFDAFIREQAPRAVLERVPMLRGRIVAAGGTKAEDLKPAEGSAWVLRGDRGITYAPALPAGSRLVAGEWWPADYSGPPLVSLEERTADDLKLKLGDTITVNVLGRNVSARIANLRAVDWQSLGINFVLVFSSGTFAGAPHTDIATLTFADGASAAEEAALVKALADAFPTISAIRVKDALDTIDHLIGNLVLGLRGASSVALIAAALVLGGALAAGQRFRTYDAVILKTLGATQLRLVIAYALEYLLIGLAAVIFGVAAGSVTANLVITRVMEFSFVWMAVPALATAVLALLVTVLLGLVGTFSALGHKPAEVLRNL
jgi:putative ABC transport system permease protein